MKGSLQKYCAAEWALIRMPPSMDKICLKNLVDGLQGFVKLKNVPENLEYLPIKTK